MVYVVGIIGFIGGFALGQMILYFLLRHKTNQDLLEDKWLKLQYGILNWVVAGFGSYCVVTMYKAYFP